MTSEPDLWLVSAAGNRFALADLCDPGADLAVEPARLARSLAGRVDGLLLLEAAPAGEVVMTLYNADGGRAEACGNGLRCIAAVAMDHGRASGSGVRVHTDAGPRWVEVERSPQGRIEAACAEMGPVVLAEAFPLDHAGRAFEVYPVSVGNPHAVVRVAAADLEGPLLSSIGPALEVHPRFPQGTNVELIVPHARSGLTARVWERGVGETAACGTGACAAARVASHLDEGAGSPLAVELPGGTLEVRWTSWERVQLRGPVLREGRIQA